MSDNTHGRERQGEHTHERFTEQLHESPRDEADNVIASHRPEKHRLHEDREQHDEAERNSERDKEIRGERDGRRG